MKKSLFAVAALSAVAGAAQAQSSVTVYGILDVGYIGTNMRGTTTKPANLQQTSSFGQSAESTSRLGFKGTEDLGGGASAFFTIETGLTPSTGAVASTWNNRQSFVGLKKNGIGQFAVGTQYTPMFNQASATDPGQLNNMTGNVIYATEPQAALNGGLTSYGATSSASATNSGFVTRTSNTLSTQTDTFGGFKFAASYTLNNQNNTTAAASNNTTTIVTTGTSGGNTNFNGWALGADYTWQKLYVAASYQAYKSLVPIVTTTSLQPTTTSANATLTTTTGAAALTTQTGGSNVQDNGAYVAATYDFGILKAYGQWINRKVTSTVTPDYYASRSAQQIGVRSYITPTVEAWASVGNGRVRTYGNAAPTANFTGYQLGSNYYLSKRTNVYAIFGSTETSSTTTTAGTSANAYALGVRHTF
ncbi:porin [Polynucleobacter sp. MWH-UH23A]|uniref:porin n=1 Tax=Polynucleobacter sp. MWH-UH23A TaxID=1855613 RepID=UPI003364D10D